MRYATNVEPTLRSWWSGRFRRRGIVLWLPRRPVDAEWPKTGDSARIRTFGDTVHEPC